MRTAPSLSYESPVWLVSMLAVLMFTAAGCSPLRGLADEPTGQEGWPPAVPEIDIVMQDGAIDIHGPVPAGRVVFRVHNAGSMRHRVTLIPLPDDLPPLDEQLRGEERRSVTPLAGTNTHPPGEGTAFAIDLESGQRYGVVCFEEHDDGTVHAREGENAEFRAGESSAGTPASPVADG